MSQPLKTTPNITNSITTRTFPVDPVSVGTEPLATERVKGSIRKLLGSPVEACDNYSASVVAQPGFHTLIAAADLAYRKHFPLVLTPDAIWLTIAQGFARHVANHAEALRARIVSHEGKAKLVVRRDDFLRGSPENPWPEVWTAFREQIGAHIGADALNLVVADFSTTGPTERAASEVVLMDCVQSYFEYDFESLCGIPTVTLEGTVADWERIRERVGRLAQYDLGWWTDEVGSIVDEFVQATKGAPKTAFWQRLYKKNNGSGGPYITGWLVRLLPYLKQREYVCEVPGDYSTGRLTPWRTDLRNYLLGASPDARDEMHGLKHEQLPSSVSAVPFTWHYRGERLEYEFLAGVMTISQDEETKALRPRIGWAVRPTPTGEAVGA